MLHIETRLFICSKGVYFFLSVRQRWAVGGGCTGNTTYSFHYLPCFSKVTITGKCICLCPSSSVITVIYPRCIQVKLWSTIAEAIGVQQGYMPSLSTAKRGRGGGRGRS